MHVTLQRSVSRHGLSALQDSPSFFLAMQTLGVVVAQKSPVSQISPAFAQPSLTFFTIVFSPQRPLSQMSAPSQSKVEVHVAFFSTVPEKTLPQASSISDISLSVSGTCVAA